MRTKRFVSLLLALVMCAALVPTMFVSADTEVTTTKPAEIYKLDFEGLTAVPSHTDAYGLITGDGYASASTVSDGVLHLINGVSGQAYLDFRYYACALTSIDQAFSMTMMLKPIGTWNRSNTDFFSFRKDTSSSLLNYFYTSGGKIGMKADGGDVLSEVLPTDSFTKVEWKFIMTEGVYTSIELFINDVKLGTTTLTDGTLTSVNHFRIFKTYNVGVGMEIDSIVAAPLTDEHVYQLRENFSDAPNTTNTAAAIQAAGGLRLATGTAQYAVENGVLSVTNAVDGNFYIDVNNYVKGKSFNFSFRINPQVAGFTGWLINIVQGNTATATKQNTNNLVAINSGKLKISGTMTSFVFPVNDWTLIDVVFNYNTNTNTYDTFTVSANGAVMGTATLAHAYTEISLLRNFQWLGTKAYQLDDLCLTEGATSMAYANGDVELVGWQESAVNAETNTKDLRLLCNIESLEWKNYAFDITVNGTALNTVTGTTVYGAVLGYDETTKAEKTYTAQELGATNLIAIVLKNISVEKNYTIEIKPYVVSEGCLAKYYGDTITVTVTASDVTVA